ncbi:MAG: L-serine ammonia-lyase, iron-sulfur-dependent, subunit alpha [Christensenellales bacterium]
MEYSVKALLAAAEGKTIARAAIEEQSRKDEAEPGKLMERMAEYLNIMRQSIDDGMDYGLRSVSGLTGGQGPVLRDAVLAGKTCGGKTLGIACARAMAIAESNAAMGKIVAAPTAGACGILPAALITVAEDKGLGDDIIIDGLFAAAAVGRVIANRASISGAKGGCQAETGSAAAMAAFAICEMLGAGAQAAASACGFALMATMGLVCDPVGGLVEIPCVYRNVSGLAVAFSSADMALAGIKCPIPADELIDAMGSVGDMMHPSLRETGEGGCAACPSARGAF